MLSAARILALGLAAVIPCLGGCSSQDAPVSFKADVQPILERACVSCHASGQQGAQASGLAMDNYEAVMKGTRFGPVVIAGNVAESTLVKLIEGRADPSIKMPHGDQPPLYQGDIQTIRDWVQQGALNN